jgi:hypothetical protein
MVLIAPIKGCFFVLLFFSIFPIRIGVVRTPSTISTTYLLVCFFSLFFLALSVSGEDQRSKNQRSSVDGFGLS